MKIYKAKTGGILKDDDAVIIGSFIDDVFPDGKVDAKKLVKAAQPKRSPIHKYFEWDDSRAAERYRNWQARKIIGSIEIEVRGENQKAFHSVVWVEDNKEIRRGYQNLDNIISSKDLTTQVFEEAMRRIKYWQFQYERLTQVKMIVSAITKTERKYDESTRSRRRSSNNKEI